MKKFGKYLIITLLLLLGLCCIGVLYLFFVPNSSLFGICYISLNSSTDSQVYAQSQYESLHTISLNSGAYNVEIVPTSGETISVSVFSNSFGFVLKKNSVTSITSKIENGSLTFNVTEPNGAAIKNRSKIYLYVPAALNKNLLLTNNSAATGIALYGGEEDLSINNLTYKTSSGNFTLSHCKVAGDLRLEIGSATFTIGDNVSAENSTIYLSMTNGRFESAAALNNITIEKNDYGTVDVSECTNLISDNSDAGGRVKINKVHHIALKGGDTNVEINTIDNGGIELSRAGRINIDTVETYLIATTKYGNININKTNGPVRLSSEDGSINVAAAYGNVQADTPNGSGDIDVTFADDAASYAVNKEARSFVSETANGKIIVHGAERVDVKITDRGRAEIYMDNVYGENKVDGENGEVYIFVKELEATEAPEGWAHYKLSTHSDNGDVNVYMHQFEHAEKSADLCDYYINSHFEDFDFEAGSFTEAPFANSLTASTNNGSLKIRDGITVDM